MVVMAVGKHTYQVKTCCTGAFEIYQRVLNLYQSLEFTSYLLAVGTRTYQVNPALAADLLAVVKLTFLSHRLHF